MDLLIACERGDIEYVKNHLTYKSNYDIIYGTDLLTQAVIFGQFEVVKLLIEEYDYLNRYINYGDMTYNNISGMSPFLWAIRTNNVEIALYLLEHGADYNSQDIYDITGYYSDKEFSVTGDMGVSTDSFIEFCTHKDKDKLIAKLKEKEEIREKEYEEGIVSRRKYYEDLNEIKRKELKEREERILQQVKLKSQNLPFTPHFKEKFSEEEIASVKRKYNCA